VKFRPSARPPKNRYTGFEQDSLPDGGIGLNRTM
jgi:hypothetical protein